MEKKLFLEEIMFYSYTMKIKIIKQDAFSWIYLIGKKEIKRIIFIQRKENHTRNLKKKMNKNGMSVERKKYQEYHAVISSLFKFDECLKYNLRYSQNKQQTIKSNQASMN